MTQDAERGALVIPYLSRILHEGSLRCLSPAAVVTVAFKFLSSDPRPGVLFGRAAQLIIEREKQKETGCFEAGYDLPHTKKAHRGGSPRNSTRLRLSDAI